MMKQEDINAAFKQLGWKTGRDEAGDSYATMPLEDRLVEIIPRLRANMDPQYLNLIESVSTPNFTEAASIIDAPLGGFWSMNLMRSHGLWQPAFVRADIERISANAIAWAKTQDIDGALAELRALPTSAPGTGPVQHLAALAMAGQVSTLETYQHSFAAGDHLGFAPYITADYIDRALAIARNHMAIG